MDSIADFFSKEEQIKVLTGKLNDSALLISDLKVENESLKARNLSLSKSNKSLNDKCVRVAISRDKLKGKHKRTALVVSELYVEGFLSLTISQIADRLFTSFDNIAGTVSAIKRGKSEKLQVNR
jgi:DNA polymerase II small subunit/DNA polymerase delta subunit B